MTERPWPAGCTKNASCARNGGCMYGCAAHRDRPGADLREEIAAETYRRLAEASNEALFPLDGQVERRVLGNIMRDAGFSEEEIYARTRPLTLP